LEHAVVARDDDLITALITASGLEQLLEGHAGRLGRILDNTPPRVLTRPAVALVAAVTALDLSDLAAADRCLRRMASSGRTFRTRRLRTLNAVVSLYRARLDGDRRATQRAINRSWAADAGDPDIDLLAWMNRGTAAAWTGMHSRAKADLRRALDLATAEQRAAAALHCRTHLAALAGAEGDLVGMRAQASSALDFAKERNWAHTARCAYLYALLGAEAYERFDTERARQFTSLAVELIAPRTDPTIELLTRILSVAITFDTASDPHEVVRTIRDNWDRLRGKQISPALVAFAAPTEQRMALRVGEVDWATDVLDRVGRLLGTGGEQALLQANLQSYKGKVSSARRLLAPVLTGQVAVISALTVIDGWLLEAQLADRSENIPRAHEALRHALGLAEPQQILRPFLDGGRHVSDLLISGIGRYGRLDRFAKTVVAAMPATRDRPSAALTNRELALLAELPSMRTAEEIAGSLFVSVNTVKTHLRGIYRKLGVNHRRDAIAAARRLGLL
jgi:LuxR family maltose regulon positive regulatory protein